jgi:hypothetical protein
MKACAFYRMELIHNQFAFAFTRMKLFCFFYIPVQFSKNFACALTQKVLMIKEYGGDEEIRTPDPLLARQVLSQLSYTPMNRSRMSDVGLIVEIGSADFFFV